MRFSRRYGRAVMWIALGAGGLFSLAVRLTPIPAALLAPPKQSIEITDRHGATLRENPVETHFAREIADVPRPLIDAILAAEDKRFFSHRGVDWIATARASWSSVRQGRVASGASTITQQLVKLAQPRARTLRTKMVESLTALHLEQRFSKEQILVAYLNRVDFGNLNIGVASAAQHYFGKPLADLSDAEAALLAGLPKNPRRLNPNTALAAARCRQQTVLRRMRDNGAITLERYERAMEEPLRLRAPRRLFRAPHFVDLVMRERSISNDVRTTLDLDLNRTVERIVASQVARLRSQNLRNAAAVVIDNATGDVLALVGSENYFAPDAGQVNGAIARRSAGSTLKPFVYLLALERGATPATIFADVPAVFATSSGLYRPENYDRRCRGPVRLRLALGNSLNIPAVKALASVGGARPLCERLRAWGFTTLEQSPETYGLGLAIGGAEVRLIELVNAYATLARLGAHKPVRILLEGAANGPSPPLAASLLSRPQEAWLIADILSDNAARTLAFGAHSPLRFDFPVACKTGTSSDFRDNWAIGYTPDFTVGVWAGNFDGSPMHEVSGVTGAAPILHDVFVELHRLFGTTWFATPTGIVTRDVHPITGKLLAAPRREAVREKFAAYQLPPLESPADYDTTGRAVLPAEYQLWLRSAENGIAGRVNPVSLASDLRVISPVPGTTYVLDPDIATSERVPLVVSGASNVLWQSDSLECRDADGATYAIAKEGEHRVTAIDVQTGRRAETWIRVRSL